MTHILSVWFQEFRRIKLPQEKLLIFSLLGNSNLQSETFRSLGGFPDSVYYILHPCHKHVTRPA